ncbi:four-helix bundle copper-binding protein [Pseudomonas japonica]|nr:four-helix bundle copper-binding protein [Pseudomonas japonica]MBA1291610.1 four-helix bundle copper-binding protein [Pseudomonas japonica]
MQFFPCRADGARLCTLCAQACRACAAECQPDSPLPQG